MSKAPATRYRALVIAVAVMVSALAAAPMRAKADADAAVVTMAGRTATITLPYRTSNHLIWVSATRVIDAAPFTFKALAIKPGAGEGGRDLAVFTYVADRPGKTNLSFGLVPPGKMLIGPPMLVFKGPARRITVTVTAK